MFMRSRRWCFENCVLITWYSLHSDLIFPFTFTSYIVKKIVKSVIVIYVLFELICIGMMFRQKLCSYKVILLPPSQSHLPVHFYIIYRTKKSLKYDNYMCYLKSMLPRFRSRFLVHYYIIIIQKIVKSVTIIHVSSEIDCSKNFFIKYL